MKFKYKVEIVMNTTFPWLRKCVKKFDVTDIGEQHDLIYIFQKPEKSMMNYAKSMACLL